MTALQIINEQIRKYDDGGDRPQSPPAWMLALRAEIERMADWEYKLYPDRLCLLIPDLPGICGQAGDFVGRRGRRADFARPLRKDVSSAESVLSLFPCPDASYKLWIVRHGLCP